MTSSLAPRTYTREELAKRMATDGGRLGGATTPFIKLQKNTTTLRLLPYPAVPFVFHKLDNPTADRSWPDKVVDYRFLSLFPTIADKAIEAGKMTQEDLDRFARVGTDPITRLAVAAKAADEEAPSGTFPNKRWLMLAIDREDPTLRPAVWDASKMAMDTIEQLLSISPRDISDPSENGYDLIVMGNGRDGKDRRYLSYSPAEEPCAVGVDFSEGWIDLEDFVARRVWTYEAKVDALFNQYGVLCTKYGLTRDQFA